MKHPPNGSEFEDAARLLGEIVTTLDSYKKSNPAATADQLWENRIPPGLIEYVVACYISREMSGAWDPHAYLY